ncbi:glycosyltransferase family 4 protein [Trinickia acidisoli]|uniref:glycosyltransferase family 4 protein n=1 Tax=Trinickia acidisoli TaxID=2767482 RepID=UPI001A8FE020|nr:glycosyltransferase family 4 protein [Trinickia acidisoli]
MRILQLVLAPRLSGAEMLVKGIAIDHRRRGHTVCIASLLPAEGDFADAARELAAHQVECAFPARRHEHFARLVFLYRTIRRFAPDIVFAHTTIPALYARALPLSAPIVFVMHSGTNDFTEHRWLGRAERLLSRRARAVVGVSQRNVDQYAAVIGRHPALFVVPNGVDVDRFSHATGVAGMADAANAASALCGSNEGRGVRVGNGNVGNAGNAADASDAVDDADGHTDTRPARCIVQIGRYMPEKGQLDTVHAFRKVLAREPGTRLHLCGVVEDRAYHARIVSLVDTLGLASSIRIDGPRMDVPDLLAQADVFAMPSRFEANSVGFLEALASGIPIVANTIPAFSFARSYAGVRLVDTADVETFGCALADALAQPRSPRRLDGLRLEDTARRYLEIARRVLG